MSHQFVWSSLKGHVVFDSGVQIHVNIDHCMHGIPIAYTLRRSEKCYALVRIEGDSSLVYLCSTLTDRCKQITWAFVYVIACTYFADAIKIHDFVLLSSARSVYYNVSRRYHGGFPAAEVRDIYSNLFPLPFNLALICLVLCCHSSLCTLCLTSLSAV